MRCNCSMLLYFIWVEYLLENFVTKTFFIILFVLLKITNILKITPRELEILRNIRLKKKKISQK